MPTAPPVLLTGPDIARTALFPDGQTA